MSDLTTTSEPQPIKDFASMEDYIKAKMGKKAIKKMLIANNGIAAVKAIRSIRKWSYETFDNDRIISFVVMATPEDLAANAEYIRMADQYFEVPGGANNNNYANVTRILEIAETAGVDAVWAGWGHASENPALPERLDKKGILFLGPHSGPMKTNVPTLPWNGSGVTVDLDSVLDSRGFVTIPQSIYDTVDIKTIEEATEACQRVGFPLMIKASEGGGGKGIRTLTSLNGLEAAFRAVQSEVPGSPIFIMRMAERCRHLEVQLLGDEYGNVIPLSGRDCSVQRRHQKIIEEGPPTSPSADVWIDMQLAAVRLAKLVGYTNAGTVEYLYMENDTYSFLELNPRLQVEHPVTEMITNVNLPAAQLQVAMGIPLYCIPDIRRLYGVDEDAITPIAFDSKAPVAARGHVIACRITAENPDAGFQPTSGAIRELNFRSTANVWGYFSVDGSGRVHEFADSQFGHLFSWGTTRDIARKNMVQALREFSIRGEIRTTIEYLLQLIQNDHYIRNRIDTSWLDGLIGNKIQTTKPNSCFVVVMAAACRAFCAFKSNKSNYLGYLKRGQIPPSDLLSTRHHEDFLYDGMKYSIDVYLSGENILTIAANGSTAQIQIRELADGGYLINANGQSHVAYVQETAAGLRLNLDSITCIFSQEYDPTILRCPNSGKLARYLVRCGDHVEQGQSFAEMEVMKMYLPLLAQEACTITQIVKATGSVVQTGDILGYVNLDDPTKVRRAEVYKDGLPELHIEVKATVKRPHHITKKAVQMLQAFIAGYWVPLNQVEFYLDCFLEAVQDSTLPFYEYLDVVSTMEACLPEALKTELDSVIFDHTISVDNASPCCDTDGECDIDTFKHDFPAKAIRQVLNKHVMMSKNHVELEELIQPVYSVIDKYTDGLKGYTVSCLFQLVEQYMNNERNFVSGSRPADVLDIVRRNTDSNHCEMVWRSYFSHNQQNNLTKLIARLLNMLSSLISNTHSENKHFNKLLQEISIYYDHAYASISLEARQLLLQRRLPSQEEEVEIVKASLQAINDCTTSEERDVQLNKLLDQTNDIRQSLMAILHDGCDDAISSAALECYLRKIYRPYILLHVMAYTKTGCNAFTFDFKSETPELPTGIRPSASFNSTESISPVYSPRTPSSDAVADNSAHGIIVHTKDITQLRDILSHILMCFTPISESERSFNAVHIVMSEAPVAADRDETITLYETVLDEQKILLTTAGVSRVTITQSPAISRIENRWDLPTSYTFRQRLGFKEDSLVRHVEPPLAYHLELHRLRNFSIRLVPIPNRNIHLYEATPKEAAVVRGTKLPIRKRFFVRAVCSTLDSLDTDKLTDSYPSVEKTLVEALNALEVGMGAARLKGDDGHFSGNHIFLNILPPVEVDPNLIEVVMKNMYLRYVRRLNALHVSQFEMRLSPILTHGAQPLPIRMVGVDPTGMALHIDTYVETRDTFGGNVIFTSINESVNDVAGEWDGHSVSMPYPVLEFLERERAYAQKSSNTLYCYDFLELIQRVMLRRWKAFLHSSEATVIMPSTMMKAKELELIGTPGNFSLKEVIRGPGKNKIGMVAWLVTLFTPTYPKDGRDIIIISNDITFKAGSFGTREDAFFHLVSERARKLGIPRIFFAANSGARIGLAEEVKKLFHVKWIQPSDPESGVDYLYLTANDYETIKDSVVTEPVDLDGTTVYRITSIIGTEIDLGVENLAGSGMIAGETSRAYREIPTLTVVTGRSVGIGAYLVRLGQRTIQKSADAPIILTGFEALNQLMGKAVYRSNDQLGGTSIMCPNGITHIHVQNDIEAVDAMLRWLSYMPSSMHSDILPQPLSAAVDMIDRPVSFKPTKLSYDVRGLISGSVDEKGDFQTGLFDKDSFMEVLADWAKTVVVGRARLGGLPIGVVATENRTVERILPADPAEPQTEESVIQQAGGVWYPDSAFKTAQAIEDINQEGLPLFIIANWRGFSGGARDMYQEVLKFGSYIVDKLVDFKQPVFVYIPPYSELRGGAFVVVDSHINPEVMEMYADPLSRAGVLEPAGVVSIKFRGSDKKEVMSRTDSVLQNMRSLLTDPQCDKLQRDDISQRYTERERQLETPYQQVAETFADLHDTADRMKAVGVIRKVVPLASARPFFYWRLRRRLLEVKIVKDIVTAASCSNEEALNMLYLWFTQSNQHRFNHECQWEHDEAVFHWMDQERLDSILLRINNMRRNTVKNEILNLGKENPYTVADGILDLLSTLSGEVKERVVSTLRRGILLRNQSQAEFYEEDEQFVEF